MNDPYYEEHVLNRVVALEAAVRVWDETKTSDALDSVKVQLHLLSLALDYHQIDVLSRIQRFCNGEDKTPEEIAAHLLKWVAASTTTG